MSIVKSIETMEVYKPALEKITKALIKVSRKTAKHEGIEASAAIIAKEIDDLVTAIQARRKRQRKEEEILILWLSNLVNSPFMQLE